MRRLAVFLILLIAPLAACDDPSSFLVEPQLATDTLELAAPSANSTLPTALDITAAGGIITGGRFPERVRDAGEWDVAVRLRGGQLVLVPAGALGLRDGLSGGTSRAAITRPITGQTFERLIEAPGRSSFLTDSAVTVQQGALYVIRSRGIACGFGGGEQYAKVQVLNARPSEGRLELQIVTNENCSDPRLALED